MYVHINNVQTYTLHILEGHIKHFVRVQEKNMKNILVVKMKSKSVCTYVTQKLRRKCCFRL